MLFDLASQILGKPAEPFCVAFRIQASGGVPELVRGQELEIMAPRGDKRVDEIIPVFRRSSTA